MSETRYQRVAREQAERQAARAERLKAERKEAAALLRPIGSARQRRRDKAYEAWCTSDFPNQEDN